MMYHCDISDPEDEMPQHPCQCIAGESFFSKRFAFRLLSLKSIIAIYPLIVIISIFFTYICVNVDGWACVFYHLFYLVYAYTRRAMVATGLEFAVAVVDKNIERKSDASIYLFGVATNAKETGPFFAS